MLLKIHGIYVSDLFDINAVTGNKMIPKMSQCPAVEIRIGKGIFLKTKRLFLNKKFLIPYGIILH